tara:strand:- start:5494 stop:5889 length:396 start_codon:yes stop_codon:yes gene_type:complete
MDENITESLIHYGYLVLFIGMLIGIIQYKNKNNKPINDILYILIGIGLFVLSLYFLRVFNSFNLYNSIVHGLGITIAVLLLLSFINHTNSTLGENNNQDILKRISEIINNILKKINDTTKKIISKIFNKST